MAAELGQQTVEFSTLVQRATDASYLALKELVDRYRQGEDQRSDSEKKIDILKFIAKTQQRILRIHVLAKWCQQATLIQHCQQLAATLSSHDTCFTQTADSLFYMHEGLQHARAPVFDVPSAIEVLLTGSYRKLPKCIEDLNIQSTLSEDEQKPTLKKLDTILRSKLLEVVIPKEINEVTVSNGTTVLRVDGEFKVYLTLGYYGHLSLWKILNIELLVGEKNGYVKLEESRRCALGDYLERRMAVSENPFSTLYTVLHELCVALVMDTLVRQVQILRQGRWKDAIRFELISDGSTGQGGNVGTSQLIQDGELDSTSLKTPGLKIIYWLEADKGSGGSDFGSSPFLKIEPGQDTQIKCFHSSFVLDPCSGKEAAFSLDQSCIDVEKLLLRAISCNRHTRLLEILRELSTSVNICRSSSDVVLKQDENIDANLTKRENSSIGDYCGDEVLKVRTCGMSYISLGINIRATIDRALERKQCFHQGGGLLHTNWGGTTTKLNTSSGGPPLAKTKTMGDINKETPPASLDPRRDGRTNFQGPIKRGKWIRKFPSMLFVTLYPAFELKDKLNIEEGSDDVDAKKIKCLGDLTGVAKSCTFLLGPEVREAMPCLMCVMPNARYMPEDDWVNAWMGSLNFGYHWIVLFDEAWEFGASGERHQLLLICQQISDHLDILGVMHAHCSGSGRFLLRSSKNALSPSTLVDFEGALNQGSLSAVEVFTSLKSKSILNLFASAGRFLGLQACDHSSTTLKIPKSILHGSDFLLMGFPQCANSYYLLMQVDKDFKPIFLLLESRSDSDGNLNSFHDSGNVIRVNKIDIGQMQVVDDELNMSLFDLEKLHSLPSNSAFNQAGEHLFTAEATLQLPGLSQTSFSSVVDEVFEFDKPLPSTNQLALSHKSPLSNTINANSYHGISANVSSPNLEGELQQPHVHKLAKVPGSSNSLHVIHSIKGSIQNDVTGSFSSSSSIKFPSIHKLPTFRSDQDMNSKAPYSAEAGQYPSVDEPPKESSMLEGNVPGQPMPSIRIAGSPLPNHSQTPNILKNSSTGNLLASSKVTGHNSAGWINPYPTPESGAYTSDYNATHKQKGRKRTLVDFIPSFSGTQASCLHNKRRKISELSDAHNPSTALISSQISRRTSGHIYGDLLSEAINGIAPSKLYVSVLLHVVRHCSLCIKHAQLTSQMGSLDIPYVEEVGLRIPSSTLWLKLPFARDDSWQHICLRLGKPGTMCWDVKINDSYFGELWELHRGNTTSWGSGVRIANISDIDSHIHYDPDGVVLSYKSVEDDSIQKLVSDLRRLSNARLFACGMRNLIGLGTDDQPDDNTVTDSKTQTKVVSEAVDKLSEQMRKTFKIEAVGLMSLWFSYGSMPVIVHFVVEWEAGKEGCTMHVSPDQLWTHTKFLEDFINGGEVASFLDCIRLTAGPLLALYGAIRPARIPVVTASHSFGQRQGHFLSPHGSIANPSTPIQHSSGAPATTTLMAQLSNHSLQTAAVLSAAGRGGPGLVPSSLLPFDVSVVLRGPYWIRIIYRKKFAVDMRCFAGDQVWLQPATPPKGGPAVGGSLPCPQFRPFIMEHVAQGLNALEPNFSGASQGGMQLGSSNSNANLVLQQLTPNANRATIATGAGISRPSSAVGNQVGGSITRVSSAMLASSGLAPGISGVPLRIPPGTGFPVHVKGELNTAFIGLGDDGGYGGGWVPLAALKKVLRGILKYLGVLWLFAQLPDLLKEILGSILKDNEGALLNLDQEQPALRFFVGGYVFAVSVHRVQLLLQVLSVKRFHHHQQQQNQSNAQEELAQGEINEICDYFSRRVASEPYDASRVASFITLLTLPISVLKEFLKLISWKKGLSQAHGGDIATAQRSRIELCLENHSGSISDNNVESSCAKSNIHHDRMRNLVDFALTFVLDPTNIPHMNAAGGAAWLPYCVSVRLRYSFGENAHFSFRGMEGSHGGRACWLRLEDWENCQHRMAKAAEYANDNSAADTSQGRLRLVADALQRTLQGLLQQLKDGAISSNHSGS
ncbi:hypothetical protein ZIOFF_054760 [Zingiber officinale]|uniref:Mediator of RNA polymerase II transcription subunit 14 n=1 Tax=Zingiber officinale TaxID=94328 RepID=A0A8J5FGE6_ZINOF|nr:hypothetical protein ZIOFF_054760 [Zingiber officinale]